MSYFYVKYSIIIQILVLHVGISGGLSLFINAEQYQYMRSYQLSAGLHVLISDEDDSKVIIDNKGLSASTGMHTAMAIKQKRVSYKHCIQN